MTVNIEDALKTEVKDGELIDNPDSENSLTDIEREERAFVLAQRKASAYAASDLVPKEYRENVPNVLIAMNLARRMEMDPLQVMQSLHVIHGKPGWSAQFLIAAFNSCGRYTGIHYRFNEDKTACRATTTEKATGEIIEGTTITIEMADKEGWLNKSGSKWKTMPEQMLQYRAAAFLVRAHAPEISLGLYTTEELRDIPAND